VPVDPKFRLKIAKVEAETPYDTSRHRLQENPELTELGGIRLADNEKETLLLELFPSVAKTFLSRQKEARYNASHQTEVKQNNAQAKVEAPITGKVVVSPMPGNVFKILVQPGDSVSAGQEVIILESMKMENSITSEYTGTVKRILTKTGANVPAGGRLIELDSIM
jgi:biotin carboxyl carrier protein